MTNSRVSYINSEKGGAGGGEKEKSWWETQQGFEREIEPRLVAPWMFVALFCVVARKEWTLLFISQCDVLFLTVRVTFRFRGNAAFTSCLVCSILPKVNVHCMDLRHFQDRLVEASLSGAPACGRLTRAWTCLCMPCWIIDKDFALDFYNWQKAVQQEQVYKLVMRKKPLSLPPSISLSLFFRSRCSWRRASRCKNVVRFGWICELASKMKALRQMRLGSTAMRQCRQHCVSFLGHFSDF